jgi:hypothetical protein
MVIDGEKAGREFGQTTIRSVGTYVTCDIRDRVMRSAVTLALTTPAISGIHSACNRLPISSIMYNYQPDRDHTSRSVFVVPHYYIMISFPHEFQIMSPWA